MGVDDATEFPMTKGGVGVTFKLHFLVGLAFRLCEVTFVDGGGLIALLLVFNNISGETTPPFRGGNGLELIPSELAVTFVSIKFLNPCHNAFKFIELLHA